MLPDTIIQGDLGLMNFLEKYLLAENSTRLNHLVTRLRKSTTHFNFAPRHFKVFGFDSSILPQTILWPLTKRKKSLIFSSTPNFTYTTHYPKSFSPSAQTRKPVSTDGFLLANTHLPRPKPPKVFKCTLALQYAMGIRLCNYAFFMITCI